MKSLKVDGGASANNFLMQFQSDIMQVPVARPFCLETTAMGAAYLAGLSVGYWKDLEDLKKNWIENRVFYPKMEEQLRMEKLKGWRRAVRYAFGWAKEEGDV